MYLALFLTSRCDNIETKKKPETIVSLFWQPLRGWYKGEILNRIMQVATEK